MRNVPEAISFRPPPALSGDWLTEVIDARSKKIAEPMSKNELIDPTEKFGRSLIVPHRPRHVMPLNTPVLPNAETMVPGAAALPGVTAL